MAASNDVGTIYFEAWNSKTYAGHGLRARVPAFMLPPLEQGKYNYPPERKPAFGFSIDIDFNETVGQLLDQIADRGYTIDHVAVTQHGQSDRPDYVVKDLSKFRDDRRFDDFSLNDPRFNEFFINTGTTPIVVGISEDTVAGPPIVDWEAANQLWTLVNTLDERGVKFEQGRFRYQQMLEKLKAESDPDDYDQMLKLNRYQADYDFRVRWFSHRLKDFSGKETALYERTFGMPLDEIRLRTGIDQNQFSKNELNRYFVKEYEARR
jgi:hypothetical protein